MPTFPKPTYKKKKPIYNGYKDKAERTCYYCKTYGAQRHEVYGGNPNRQISIREKFQVDLCEKCHEGIQKQLTQEDIDRKIYWQQYHQARYEKKLIDSGIRPEQTRAIWMSLIGWNYL